MTYRKQRNESRAARRLARHRVGHFDPLECRRVLAAVPLTFESLDQPDADGPVSVAVGDIDGDGDSDVIVGSYRDGKLAWFEQGSNGDYRHRPIAAGIDYLRAVVAADFDGDGDLDLAAASYTSDQVIWLENTDGHGTFGAPILITAQADGARTLAAGDLDADGDIDLAVGSWFDDRVVWFANQGGGIFGGARVITSSTDGPRAIQLADVNSDGRLDLVVASRQDDTISWFANDGSGNFGAQRKLPSALNGPESIALADADGDGDLDLAVAVYWEGKIAWFRNTDGQGTFGLAEELATNANRGQHVAWADLDGDGDQDLVGAWYYNVDNELAWFRNDNGQGIFSAARTISTDIQAIKSFAISDLDRNQSPDIVSVGILTNKISWHANQQGTFAAPRSINRDASGAGSVDLGDIDGDGDLDVVAAAYWDNEIAWYENLDGRGHFGVQRLITQDARRAQNTRLADLDADGDLDVLSASSGDGKIAWYPNLDGRGTFGPQRIITNRLNGPVYVHATDIDGDGDLDVVSASAGDSIVAWFANTDGRGTFGAIQIVSRRAIEVEWLDATDLDSDGDQDLLVASYGDDTLGWYANTNGQGTFGARQTLATGDGPTTLRAADLDGDGDQDLVATLYNTGQVIWLERLATPLQFAPARAIASNLSRLEALTIADVDGNGVVDVVVGADVAAAWLDRQNDGTFVTRLLPGRVEQMFDIEAGDLDGNGTTDLVGTSFQDHRISLYRNGAMLGDFDFDGNLDQADLDLLCSALRETTRDLRFDLNADQRIDDLDLTFMVRDLLQSTFGDANLDRVFDSRDLVLTFQFGQYEDAIPGNSGWAQGDWTCDGDFNTRDLVVAFQGGGYVAGATVGATPASPVWDDPQWLVTADHLAPQVIVRADLNNDGLDDLIVASDSDGRLGWYEANNIGQFSSQQLIAINLQGVTDVTVGDIDADGDLDLFAAIGPADRVSWWENILLERSFSDERVITDKAIGVSDILLADWDGDGDLDLAAAAAETYDSSITWYENGGAGARFMQERLITTELEEPRSIAAADIDGDQDLDLVVASYADQHVSWIANLDGQGTFGESRIMGQLQGATEVAVGDLDGDGDQDVVAGTQYYPNDQVAWYENLDGQGSFDGGHTISTHVDEIGSIELADVDADQDLDVLVASSFDAQLTWFLNTGGADRFGQTLSYQIEQRDVWAATPIDLSKDGDLDVAWIGHADDVVMVIEHLPDGWLASRSISRLGFVGASATVAADVNCDGALDVAAVSAGTGELIYFRNLGVNHFDEPKVIDNHNVAPLGMWAAHLNGDFCIDLIVADTAAGTVAWYENITNPFGGFARFSARQVITTNAPGVESVTTGDLNGDGFPDLIVSSNAADRSETSVQWFLNTSGRGTFVPGSRLPTLVTNARQTVVADFDGDGHQDLAYVSAFNHQVRWLANPRGDGTFFPTETSLVTNRRGMPQSLAAGDLDQDGDIDLAVAFYMENRVAWLANLDGQGRFGELQWLAADVYGPLVVQLLDVDRDNDLDIVTASVLDDTLGWFENQPGDDPFAVRHTISTRASGINDFAAGDFERDGDLDFVAALFDEQRVAYYRNITPVPGDLDGNGFRTIDDIEFWRRAFLAQQLTPVTDLIPDQQLDQRDLDYLLIEFFHSKPGDVTLDGRFDSMDLVAVFTAGNYEIGPSLGVSWATGDWNLDGQFSTSDLVLGWQYGFDD